jgi:hypothetical protein
MDHMNIFYWPFHLYHEYYQGHYSFYFGNLGSKDFQNVRNTASNVLKKKFYSIVPYLISISFFKFFPKT